MQYRAEIDGLRALAVVPVVLFHAGFDSFSGGFVGVDVFFVISGYLIGTIILEQLSRDQFSLREFYVRRARRILPALFLVMSCCLVPALLLLGPGELEAFGRSVIATVSFSSNFLFWQESGYFESAAELKPLLHTWSLAVEEQYYVFFPLLAMFVWRWQKRGFVGVILALAVISLLASIVTLEWSASANFYLLPTRAWELLAGVLAGVYLLNKPPHNSKQALLTLNVLSALGLGLIIYAVFGFDRQTSFPGLNALVPVIGTVLIILFAMPGTLVGSLLRARVLVGIGLVSYSFYLWHQPVLVFDKYYFLSEPDLLRSLMLISFAMLLAVLSWRYVERPFRDAGKISVRQLCMSCVSVAIALVLFSGFVIYKHGLPGRFSYTSDDFLQYFENSRPQWAYFEREDIPAKQRFDCDLFDIPRYRNNRSTSVPRQIPASCYERDMNHEHAVLLWGDSHAQMLSYGLSNNLPDDWQLLQIASSMCLPALVQHPSDSDFCRHANWLALDTVKRANPEVVVVGRQYGHTVDAMNQLADALVEAGAKRIIFTGPSPRWQPTLPTIMQRQLSDDAVTSRYRKISDFVIESDQALSRAYPNRADRRYLSIIDSLCTQEGCLTYIGRDRQQGITSYDSAHLTPVASDYFAKNSLVPAVVNEWASKTDTQ